MLPYLPLEILDKVFGYLNEKEQVKAAQVHPQLGRAFAYHVGGNYKRLNCCHFVGDTFVLRYTYDEFRVILSLCGSTVVDISIKSSDVTDRIGELIEKYCINLESAFIEVTDGNFNAIKRVLSMKGLHDLVLNCYRYRGSDLLQHINPNCTKLCLMGMTTDQEEHLRQLTNLEKLDVESVEFRNIFEICSHLRKDKTDALKQELMNKLPNSEVWDLITLTDIQIYCT